MAPGFESVRDLYEREMRTMAEENTQLCVYYQGEKVVDLWASAGNDSKFSPDSLVNIFSSGKSLEAIATRQSSAHLPATATRERQRRSIATRCSNSRSSVLERS